MEPANAQRRLATEQLDSSREGGPVGGVPAVVSKIAQAAQQIWSGDQQTDQVAQVDQAAQPTDQWVTNRLPKPDQQTAQAVQIVPAQLTMIGFMMGSIREADRAEFQALFGPCPNCPELTNRCPTCPVMEAMLGKTVEMSVGHAWAALVHGQPALMFGVAILQNAPHMGLAWGFGTDKAWRSIPKVSRFIRGIVVPDLIARGVRRVEVRVLTRNKSSVSWLADHMDARFEAALVEAGAGGESFFQFAWTRHQFSLPKILSSG